jgi:hypothetical protein
MNNLFVDIKNPAGYELKFARLKRQEHWLVFLKKNLAKL